MSCRKEFVLLHQHNPWPRMFPQMDTLCGTDKDKKRTVAQLDAVVSAADDVIAAIDQTQLAVLLSVKCPEDTPGETRAWCAHPCMLKAAACCPYIPTSPNLTTPPVQLRTQPVRNVTCLPSLPYPLHPSTSILNPTAQTTACCLIFSHPCVYLDCTGSPHVSSAAQLQTLPKRRPRRSERRSLTRWPRRRSHCSSARSCCLPSPSLATPFPPSLSQTSQQQAEQPSRVPSSLWTWSLRMPSLLLPHQQRVKDSQQLQRCQPTRLRTSLLLSLRQCW